MPEAEPTFPFSFVPDVLGAKSAPSMLQLKKRLLKKTKAPSTLN
jgi:hypothetical protein